MSTNNDVVNDLQKNEHTSKYGVKRCKWKKNNDPK